MPPLARLMLNSDWVADSVVGVEFVVRQHHLRVLQQFQAGRNRNRLDIRIRLIEGVLRVVGEVVVGSLGLLTDWVRVAGLRARAWRPRMRLPSLEATTVGVQRRGFRL